MSASRQERRGDEHLIGVVFGLPVVAKIDGHIGARIIRRAEPHEAMQPGEARVQQHHASLGRFQRVGERGRAHRDRALDAWTTRVEHDGLRRVLRRRVGRRLPPRSHLDVLALACDLETIKTERRHAIEAPSEAKREAAEGCVVGLRARHDRAIEAPGDRRVSDEAVACRVEGHEHTSAPATPHEANVGREHMHLVVARPHDPNQVAIHEPIRLHAAERWERKPRGA